VTPSSCRMMDVVSGGRFPVQQNRALHCVVE
jgi:hypothetical protein